MGKKRLIIKIALFILIFFLFIFFRFYNLSNRFIFDWDQEYLSNFLKNIIVNHDLILIGHRATSETGFFFGPYFEYLFVPFYFFSRMHPNGLISFIYLINIVFFAVAYLVIKKLFNQPTAIGFLFFWALNHLFVVYDTIVWAPILIPLGIILTWYFLWRLYKKGELKNYLLLGLTLGFFTQIHSLFFPIDIFAAVFLMIALFAKNKLDLNSSKKILISIGGFLFFFLPLVVFDLRHNFLNSKLFIGYFTERIQGTVDIKSSIEVYGNFLKPLLFYNNIFLTLAFHLLILALLIYLTKKRQGFLKVFYLTSLILWIITTITFLRYNQRPSEYYFIYLYPTIVVSVLDFFYQKNKYITIVLALIFFVNNINYLRYITQSHELGLMVKEKAVLKLKNILEGKKYNLSYEVPIGFNTGYEYLLEYYNIKPSGDDKDPLVILRIPKQKGDVAAGKIGFRIPPELKP